MFQSSSKLTRTLLVLLSSALAGGALLSSTQAQNTPPSQGTPPGGGSGGEGSPGNGDTPPRPNNPNNPTLPGQNNPNPNQPGSRAPNNAGSGLAPGVAVSPQDYNALFLSAVQQSNRFEIESSQAALTKNGLSAATRNFAQMMVTEHTKAQTQVIQLAQKKNLEAILPKDSGPINRALIVTLGSLNGAAFQREYLAAQYDGHANTIKIMRGYIQNGRDAEIKALAQKLLPSVQSHFYMVGRLIATNGQSSGSKMNMTKPAPSGNGRSSGSGPTNPTDNAGNGGSSNGAGAGGSSGNGGNNNGAGGGTPPRN